MKLKMEDILKPGAVLTVEKIEPNDPRLIAMQESSRKAAEAYRRYKASQRHITNYRITI